VTPSRSSAVGREVDAEIAERIMGAVWRQNSTGTVRVLAPLEDEYLSQFPIATPELMLAGDWNRWIPEYSTSIAAAMQVVEAMRGSGCCVHIDAFPDLEYKVAVRKETGECFNSDAEPFDALPFAICRCALTALPLPDGQPDAAADGGKG
jgi:hypothetical protein